MALTPYESMLLRQFRDFGRETGNTSVASFLPGNLSPFGFRFLRERGIDPSVPSDVSTSTTEPASSADRNRPPKNYDPNWFKPQGAPPATPSANAAVAAQSQVIRTPEEIRAQYERQLANQSAEDDLLRPLRDAWNQYKAGFGNLSTAIQDELGGRMTAMGTSAPSHNTNITLSPGSIGLYRPTPTDGTGQAYLPVPQEYTPRWPSKTPFNIDGPVRTPSINQNYANELAGMIRQQMRDGGPIVPSPVVGSASVPSSPELWARSGVNDALTNWVDAYNTISRVPQDANGRPTVLNGAGGNGGSAARDQALTDSYNNYVSQWHSNKVTENQAYQDQMGGGFFGGVLPSAQNPQWYDTTPTWDPRQREIGGDRAKEQAQNSPWGQAGAPWASQAWAGGIYNPQRGPLYAGMGQQGEGGNGGMQPWSGPAGMFAPQQGFNPNLATNAPWAPPKQQNNAFGATSTPGMTFGASPWGSFW